MYYNTSKTSLQAQALSNASPPIEKSPPSRKIALTFEPVMKFGCPSGFREVFTDWT